VLCRMCAGKSPVRAAYLSSDKESIVIGTQACEIAEIKPLCGGQITTLGESRQGFPCHTNVSGLSVALEPVEVARKSLVVGHFKDELWGLAVRPTTDGSDQDEYCTVNLQRLVT
jgi:hypothetical protein